MILQQNIISSSSASGVRTKELKSTVSNFKSPILLCHSWTLHPFLTLAVLWCQRFWHTTDQQRSKTRGFKECVLENMQTWTCHAWSQQCNKGLFCLVLKGTCWCVRSLCCTAFQKQTFSNALKKANVIIEESWQGKLQDFLECQTLQHRLSLLTPC